MAPATDLSLFDPVEHFAWIDASGSDRSAEEEKSSARASFFEFVEDHFDANLLGTVREYQRRVYFGDDGVLRADAIFEADEPIELLSGGFDPGAPWASVFVSSGRQCGRTAAMSKPPLDDQRGPR